MHMKVHKRVAHVIPSGYSSTFSLTTTREHQTQVLRTYAMTHLRT